MTKETCELTPNDKSSCSTTNKGCKTSSLTKNLDKYWCGKYASVDYKTLGWYEEESSPSLKLIKETKVAKNALIFNVGAGATTLIDSLLEIGYHNLIANDISSYPLDNIKKRIGEEQSKVEFITDDLVNPTILNELKKVDIWNDRAVLHFFIKVEDQDNYFKLLNQKVKKNGFVILAEFNLEGATKCSGLPVKRYNTKMLQEKLGKNYKLLNDFNYDYKMPNGEIRKYIYTLFQRID